MAQNIWTSGGSFWTPASAEFLPAEATICWLWNNTYKLTGVTTNCSDFKFPETWKLQNAAFKGRFLQIVETTKLETTNLGLQNALGKTLRPTWATSRAWSLHYWNGGNRPKIWSQDFVAIKSADQWQILS